MTQELTETQQMQRLRALRYLRRAEEHAHEGELLLAHQMALAAAAQLEEAGRPLSWAEDGVARLRP